MLAKSVLIVAIVASVAHGFARRSADEEHDHCDSVPCVMGNCPPGQCAPRNPGDCCDDIKNCKAVGCCGAHCAVDNDCTPGLCGHCLVTDKAKGEGTCVNATVAAAAVAAFNETDLTAGNVTEEESASHPASRPKRSNHEQFNIDTNGLAAFGLGGDHNRRRREAETPENGTMTVNGTDANHTLANATVDPREALNAPDNMTLGNSTSAASNATAPVDCSHKVPCPACPRPDHCAPLAADGCCPDLTLCSSSGCCNATCHHDHDCHDAKCGHCNADGHCVAL